MLKTLRLRVKDKHRSLLNKLAFEVNQVWNAANSLSAEFAMVPIAGFGWFNCNTSEYDLQKEIKCIRQDREMTILSSVMQETISIHAKSRKQQKKNKLRWRCSGGSRKALGWVPFKKSNAKYVNGQIRFCGHNFSLWDTYDLSKYELRNGSFSQDGRGRWYFNVVIEIEPSTNENTLSVGIDLGLKQTATCSDGSKLDRKQRYRNLEPNLAIAQRANKKRLVKSIYARIKNQRKDDIHKFSNQITSNFGAVFVGNVSSLNLSKTNMAKSIYDAGWYMLKTQLEYKAKSRSVMFFEVDERYTTQSCSCCGEVSASSPKGRAGLEIREWSCAGCGTLHDRDINAAKNILRIGHDALAVGAVAGNGRRCQEAKPIEKDVK